MTQMCNKTFYSVDRCDFTYFLTVLVYNAQLIKSMSIDSFVQ